jgi:allantoin racemase
MKILWIAPIMGFEDAEIEKTGEYLRKFSFPETEVVIRKVSRGTESVESLLDEAYATPPILEEALRGEREGFDACIIGCAGDAGVLVAKEVLKIPVIGPGEASILISQLIGKRIVILTTLPERIPSLEDKVTRYISPNRFFIYPANTPVLEMRKDVARTVEILTSIIQGSIEKDRTDTAILACLSMLGMAEEIQQRVQIPVIDPAIAALEMAQAVVKMKLSQTKKAYPFPPEKKRFL